jgi:threonine synthase
MVNAAVDTLFVSAVALLVVALRARKYRQAPTYTSTRSLQSKSFEEAVLLGLANDGGLFVPVRVPAVTSHQLGAWRHLDFAQLALRICGMYVPKTTASSQELERLVLRSYDAKTRWRSPKITPVVTVATSSFAPPIHFLELFHGPTFAFKDVALQFLGNLFEHLLSKKQGEEAKITVLGATSGDTGSSAIYGMSGKRGIECVILFPEGRVSEIQERQMTTVPDRNVHCVAIRGTFDDAQDIVKAAFKDEPFRAKFRLAAVNSINWARIMAQITYYFFAYYELMRMGCKTDKLVFVVPTGNFGDVLAGYYAKRMGLPVHKFVVATNENDILHRFFTTGVYRRAEVQPTSSPSMDICVSSNFERFLFHMLDDDAKRTAQLMQEFDRTKEFKVSAAVLGKCQDEMMSFSTNQHQVKECIKRTALESKYVLDPHTAVAAEAAHQLQLRGVLTPAHTVVVVGTAHWAKFQDAVEDALGAGGLKKYEFPKELEALRKLPTRKEVVDAELQVVEELIRHSLGR